MPAPAAQARPRPLAVIARRVYRLVFLALAGMILVGCGAGPGVDLRSWTLRAESIPVPVDLELPAHFDERLPDHATRYTLSTLFAVPESYRARDLTLSIPFFTGVTTLRSGAVILTPLDSDLVTGFRARGPQAWQIPRTLTDAPTLPLTLEVSHQWTQSAWLDTVPRITLATQRDSRWVRVRICNDLVGVIAFSTLFQLGWLYFAIFLVDTRRRSFLWFGIQALTVSYYNVYQLGVTQSLGDYDAAFLAITLAAAPYTAIHFTHAHFGLGHASRAWTVLFAATVLIVLLTHGPFLITRWGARCTIGTVCLTIGYEIFTYVRLSRRGIPGARIMLGCWLFLAGTAWPDLTAWAGFGEAMGGMHGACPGLAIFAIFQALLLGREHIFTLGRSDSLNVELAGRIRLLETHQLEIQQLNDELRRQIVNRSRQLFAALGLAAGAGLEALDLAPGDLVETRYRVLRKIGAGGMGSVFEVERVADGRRLALKVTIGVDAGALARLAREAQLAAQISHPNIVSIVDVDVAEAGFLFVVMELIVGPTLDASRERFGDASWALPVLAQIAEGLAALHASAIVHRDLKPANVMIARGDGGEAIAKITDFGISRVAGGSHAHPARSPAPADTPSADATLMLRERPEEEGDLDEEASEHGAPALHPGRRKSLTREGLIAGTPAFMAPEVTGWGAVIAPAADVFSFGIMAFDMLAREYPFTEPPALAQLQGRTVSSSTPLRTRCPDLDPETADLVDACLSLDPAQRPTARDLATYLSARAART